MNAKNLIFISLLLPACFSVAQADQVLLKNGDVLTGNVVAKRNDILTFHTDYAGDLAIHWSNVRTLSTTSPIAVLLNDDSYQKIALAPSNEGQVKLVQPVSTPDGYVTMAENHGLNDVLYLNPTPEESGRGYQWTARANLAFLRTGGNSDTNQLNANGEAVRRAKVYRFTIGAETNQTSNSGQDAVANSRIYSSIDHFYTPTNFMYAQGSLQQDRFRDMQLRSVLGTGYGYQVYESENTKLSIKGGPDLVSIKHYLADSEQFVALGWHIDLTHKLRTMPIELFHSQDGYRSLNNQGAISLQTRSGLRVPISNGLTATAQFNYDWESNPTPGLKNADSKLMFGLGYSYN